MSRLLLACVTVTPGLLEPFEDECSLRLAAVDVVGAPLDLASHGGCGEDLRRIEPFGTLKALGRRLQR